MKAGKKSILVFAFALLINTTSILNSENVSAQDRPSAASSNQEKPSLSNPASGRHAENLAETSSRATGSKSRSWGLSLPKKTASPG